MQNRDAPAQFIPNRNYCSFALSKLAASLPQELYKEALSAAQTIQFESDRSLVLIELAVNFPQKLYKEGLGAAFAINKFKRGNFLNEFICKSTTFSTSQQFTIW